MSKGFWILEDKITGILMVSNHLFDVVIIVQNDSSNFSEGQGSTGAQVLQGTLRDAQHPSHFMGLEPPLNRYRPGLRNHLSQFFQKLLLKVFQVFGSYDCCCHKSLSDDDGTKEGYERLPKQSQGYWYPW